MIVAQTYKHASPLPVGQKRASNAHKARSRKAHAGEKREKEAQSDVVGPAFLPAPSSPSQPMVIPTRTRDGTRKSYRRQGDTTDSKTSNVVPKITAHSIPTTSSLLEKFSFGQSEPKADGNARPIIIKSKEKLRNNERLLRKSVSSGSPRAWDLLLSPPEIEDFESSSYESELTLGPRSVSSDSAPSLLEDDVSISSSSVPATPGLSGNIRGEKRSKSISTSYGEDCILSHPLRPLDPEPILESEEDLVLALDEPIPQTPSQLKSFKSNLSAAIRSAARSLSDLAPPTIPSDHLSRSLLTLNLPYTTERHPLSPHYHDPPTFSPSELTIPLSPRDLHIHHDSTPQDSDCLSAVQLQTYTPGARQSAHASSPPIFHHSDDPAQNQSKGQRRLDALDTEDADVVVGKKGRGERQREPRENRDFLRVIVLEMNMRKVGKLTEREPGRARLWLPARTQQQGVQQQGGAVVDVDGEKGDGSVKGKAERVEVRAGAGAQERVRTRVPARWVGEESS